MAAAVLFAACAAVATSRVPAWALALLLAPAFVCFLVAVRFGDTIINRRGRRMQLTRKDIAILHDGGAMDGEVPSETVEHLKQYVRAGREFAAVVEELTQVADAIGLPTQRADRLTIAVEVEEELDQLLAADPEWSHPAEILDPGGEKGLELTPLVKLAQALQGKKAPEKLPSVLEKLEAAYERQREEEAFVRRFVEGALQRGGKVARRLAREVAAGVEAVLAAKDEEEG